MAGIPELKFSSARITSRHKAQLRITARMYIAAPAGRLGLRGAAARRSATWPFALVGLRATSHTCDSLCEIRLGLERAEARVLIFRMVIRVER